MDTSSTPAAPLLAFTRFHASDTFPASRIASIRSCPESRLSASRRSCATSGEAYPQGERADRNPSYRFGPSLTVRPPVTFVGRVSRQRLLPARFCSLLCPLLTPHARPLHCCCGCGDCTAHLSRRRRTMRPPRIRASTSATQTRHLPYASNLKWASRRLARSPETLSLL